MSMKLYLSPGACSLAVHIALREVGASFEIVKVDLATHQAGSGSDYYQVSPNGYVPLLEIADGSRHTETAALLQYIGDLAPAQRLIPPSSDAEARLKVVQWLAFIATELHKTLSWLWSKETADSTANACRTKLADRLQMLDRHLADHRYLAGPDFTVADAYGFTIVNWTNFLDISLQPFPHVIDYQSRVAKRPAVRDAMLAEGLLKS